MKRSFALAINCCFQVLAILGGHRNRAQKHSRDTSFQAEQATRSGDLGKAAEITYGTTPKLEAELRDAEQQISNKSGRRFLKEEVTADDIAEVVAKWTGIPVTRMMESERERLAKLEVHLADRSPGLEHLLLGRPYGLAGRGDPVVVPPLRLVPQHGRLVVQCGQAAQHAAIVGALEVSRLQVTHDAP